MSDGPLAIVTTFPELIDVFRGRRRAMGLTQLALDDLAGLPDGYTGKLECDPARKNHRGIGYLSLPLILEALRLELVVQPATAVRPAHAPLSAVMAERGRKGGRARAQRLTPEQRADAARRAAQARWRETRSG